MASEKGSSSNSSLSLSNSNAISNQVTLATTASTEDHNLLKRRQSGSLTLSVSGKSKLLQIADDFSEYTKRLGNLFTLTNPKHLFCTELDIKQCQKLLKQAEDGTFGYDGS